MTHEEIARIFGEWKTRYDTNPEWFSTHEEFLADKPEDYAQVAARYFLLLKEEIDVE